MNRTHSLISFSRKTDAQAHNCYRPGGNNCTKERKAQQKRNRQQKKDRAFSPRVPLDGLITLRGGILVTKGG